MGVMPRTVNEMLMGGSFFVTVVEHEPGGADPTALLTVRGKDHDLTVEDCELLAEALLLAADALREQGG
jgi:hypothetical protein